MSVLINLLPDTRQVKLRDRRRRQLAGGIAVTIWSVCGAAILLMGLYEGSQKLIIDAQTKKITANEAKLEATPGLVDALTAQEHLAALPALYAQRTYLTKFFEVYTESNPADITLTSLTMDASNVLTVNGSGKTYEAVAKLARALEANHVSLGKQASTANAAYFTNVSLQSVSRSNNQVSFTLNATLDAGVTHGN
ncbi:MAG: hypothetical protein JWN01_1012 [Patescibacteria group bacterium]|nr:hypothetical protein [Patescibacteria group bacterium]